MPELKQFADLRESDFQRYPVWIACHTADYGKPWYEQTDEETFRPWTGQLPAALTEGMLLVRAIVELRDGSRYPGFVTPAFEDGDLGTQQPQAFTAGRSFGFWGGICGVPIEERREFYAALQRAPDEVFPLSFSAEPGLATGIVTGRVEGFYQEAREGIRVER
jgi:hypothetical protein